MPRGAKARARARGDGVNYAVIFNKANRAGGTYATQIRMALDALIESGKIKWPDK